MKIVIIEDEQLTANDLAATIRSVAVSCSSSIITIFIVEYFYTHRKCFFIIFDDQFIVRNNPVPFCQIGRTAA